VKVLFLSSIPQNPNHYLARAAYDAIKNSDLVTEIYWGEYHNAIELATTNQPDALLVFDGQSANNVILRQLANLCPRKAIWFCEDPYEVTVNKQVTEYFDLVFTNDKDSCQAYGKNSFHLPLAASIANNHFAITEEPKRYDIFFAGTAWPNRLEVIHELKGRFPELKWKLILISNPQLDDHIKDLKKGLEFSNGVSIRDFSALANQSAITLALPRKFSTSEDPIASSQTPGPRLFEAALAGACQLVDIETMPLTNSLLPDNEAFISYTNIDDCAGKIEKILADKTYRNTVAKQAQKITKSKHLFDDRIKVICEKLQSLNVTRANNVDRRCLKKTILFVSHNSIRHGHFGGSEIYLDNLESQLCSDFECYTLAHDGRDNFGSKYTLYNFEGKTLETFKPIQSFNDTQISNHEIELYFQKTLSRLGVDVVFYNHCIGFPLTFFQISKSQGCKNIFVLHDYYLICDSFNLLNHNGHFCGISSKNEDICNACTYKRRGYQAGSQGRRRNFIRQASRKIDALIAGSQSSLDLALDLYPSFKGKEYLKPPAMRKPTFEKLSPTLDNSVTNIALLGNFSINKGSRLAIELFKLMRSDPIHFHIFGKLHVDYKTRAELRTYKNVHWHGSFEQGNLPNAIKACSLGIILSNWPETFCMVLSELWEAQVVPIVAPIGALAERIEHGVNGIKLQSNKPALIREQITKLISDRDLLDSLNAQRPTNPCPDPIDYGFWTKKLILKLTLNNNKIEPISDAKILTFRELGFQAVKQHWATGPQINLNCESSSKRKVVWHKRIYRRGVAVKKSLENFLHRVKP
jgi:glycosyltransferase involved in cell wall biosynthesis/spore maturation protein CgeB